jgi:lipopolysaccharide export system ATP-binding protein
MKHERVDRSGAKAKEQPRGLSVVGLTKNYGRRTVLRRISLDVAPGEVVGILGPNGAGKTICFYAIIGLVVPDAGRIVLNGVDVTALTIDQRALIGLGYLPQEASIFRGLSVAQNIEAVLELREPHGDARRHKLDALLAEFRIGHLRNTAATALSGGERRRCEIARAMAADPTIMLLDEPFAGIDPLSILDIKAMVRALSRRGVGVLITDHNAHDMLELVDRAYIFYKGGLLTQGTPAQLIADPSVRRLYLGEDFDSQKHAHAAASPIATDNRDQR